MSCPSRTDDTQALRHNRRNQNTRFLAPDLTTHQDFNDISNARENKNDESGTDWLRGSPNWMGILPVEEKNARNHFTSGRVVSLTLSGIKPIHVRIIEILSDRFHSMRRSPQDQQ